MEFFILLPGSRLSPATQARKTRRSVKFAIKVSLSLSTWRRPTVPAHGRRLLRNFVGGCPDDRIVLNLVPQMDSQSVGFDSVHCAAVPCTTGLTMRRGQKPKCCDPVYWIIASAPRVCAYSAILGRGFVCGSLDDLDDARAVLAGGFLCNRIVSQRSAIGHPKLWFHYVRQRPRGYGADEGAVTKMSVRYAPDNCFRSSARTNGGRRSGSAIVWSTVTAQRKNRRGQPGCVCSCYAA